MIYKNGITKAKVSHSSYLTIYWEWGRSDKKTCENALYRECLVLGTEHDTGCAGLVGSLWDSHWLLLDNISSMQRCWSVIWQNKLDDQFIVTDLKVVFPQLKYTLSCHQPWASGHCYIFYSNWAFPDCNSSFNSTMDLEWCTKLDVVCALLFFKVIYRISRSPGLINRWFQSNLSKIARPVAAIKSLRFALFIHYLRWFYMTLHKSVLW